MDGSDTTEESASSEEASIQSTEAAISEFEQQLAAERAELEALRLRVAELEQQATLGDDGDGTGGPGTESLPGGESSASPEVASGLDAGPEQPIATVELVSEESDIIELPPRSTHPLYRRIFGRDLDGEPPGEHFLHRKIRG